MYHASGTEPMSSSSTSCSHSRPGSDIQGGSHTLARAQPPPRPQTQGEGPTTVLHWGFPAHCRPRLTFRATFRLISLDFSFKKYLAFIFSALNGFLKEQINVAVTWFKLLPHQFPSGNVHRTRDRDGANPALTFLRYCL